MIQEENCFSDHSGVANDDGTMIYLFGGWDQDYVGQTTVVTVEILGDGQLSFSTTEPMKIVSLCCLAFVACPGGVMGDCRARRG